MRCFLLIVLIALACEGLVARAEEPTEEERQEIARLVAKLRGRSAAQRTAAAAALGRYGSKAKEAIGVLLGHLKSDPDETVRCTVAEALGRIDDGSPMVVEALADALKKDGSLRRSAAIALAELGPKGSDALPDLLKAAAANEPQTRREVYRALGRIGSPKEKTKAKILEALQRGLKEADRAARLAAAVALVRLEAAGKGVVVILREAVADDREEKEARIDAADALERLGPLAAEAVPDLVVALEERFRTTPGIPYAQSARDQQNALRAAAARALGAIGPAARGAIPALEAVTDEADPALRKAASEALERIKSE